MFVEMTKTRLGAYRLSVLSALLQMRFRFLSNKRKIRCKKEREMKMKNHFNQIKYRKISSNDLGIQNETLDSAENPRFSMAS